MDNANIGRIMGVGIPANDDVINVEMGTCKIVDDNKTHLITYGLGPCVGVAVVIKTDDEKVIRLLAHLDIGETIGLDFRSFRDYLSTLKQKCANRVKDIEIQLVSSVSFIRYFLHNKLTLKEEKLLVIILSAFKEYNIGFNDLKINRDPSVTQVQISPSGAIRRVSEKVRGIEYNNLEPTFEYEKEIIPKTDVNNIDGLFVTKYGAFMSNLSLSINCAEEEKQEKLSEDCWQKYIKKGYKLNVAPSIINENEMAVYLENWQDFKDEYGFVPGCYREFYWKHK